MTSTINVKVTVLDVNDNSPYFLQDTYVGNVSETAPNDTLIITVTAEDPDVVGRPTVHADTETM